MVMRISQTVKAASTTFSTVLAFALVNFLTIGLGITRWPFRALLYGRIDRSLHLSYGSKNQ